MATFIQRGQTIGNALINGTATLAQLDRLGKALAYREARETEYLAGDNNVKAQIYVEAFRAFCLRALREYEGAQAVTTAKATAEAAIDTDFPEVP
jgi:hypothetical protein